MGIEDAQVSAREVYTYAKPADFIGRKAVWEWSVFMKPNMLK
jgi:hypothetical protein